VVPVDGTVVEGVAVLDQSALTGESLPAQLRSGETVLSGSTNVGDAFDLKATRLATESTYAGVVRLVEAAQRSRAPMSRLADRYAIIFLAVTAVLAGAAWLLTGDPIRAVAVLVVATPCPLILAVPVAIVAGLSRAAKLGILIKGGRAIETLARVSSLVIDKTGTLTHGQAKIVSTRVADSITPDDLLRIAASLDQASKHIIAQTIVAEARGKGLALAIPTEVVETPGEGIMGKVDGRPVMVGGLHFVAGKVGDAIFSLLPRERAPGALAVAIAVDGQFAGLMVLSDELRAGTEAMLHELRALGIERIVLATGDRHEVAQAVANGLSIDLVRSDLTPDQKILVVLSERKNGPVMMIGDGVNDAPALAAADVGIAMGARGASASSEAADVVILADRLDRVGEAIVIAQRACRIALESIVAGMSLSLLAMLAASVGWVAPVAAALVQEVIDVAVILNALRALRSGKQHVRHQIPAAIGRELHHDHVRLGRGLDRLRSIADALDDAEPDGATALVTEANMIVQREVVAHEREDEGSVYPKIARALSQDHGLSAMSRAHREILHLARLLARLVEDLPLEKIDRYLIRDAQRVIEAIEALVRIHIAQEDDIYEAVVAS
jgi:heavy metal translocating P-type ATPase